MEHEGESIERQAHLAALVENSIQIYEAEGDEPPAIIRQYGTWAVTVYGVECLTEHYAIEKTRLWEPDWVDHMEGKNWVEMGDFIQSLHHAQIVHREWKGHHSVMALDMARPGIRYEVMQADGFRCRLCGKTAADGARLEVDHIKARAKGGANDRGNLWTLCATCNIGKRDRDIIL